MQKSLIQDKKKITENNLEAILVKEPHDNSYEVIEPYKTFKYPFCFVGLVKCKFFFEGKIYEGEGVGTLIGPQIVFTSAHNLMFNVEKRVVSAYSVEFIPCLNGSFKVFENVKSTHQVIPEKFKAAKKKGNFEEMVQNDYCLVLLDRNFGDELVKYLDLDENNINLDLEVKDHFYSFFENNQNIHNLNMKKSSLNNLQYTKVSMISYTKYNERSLKLPSFIYRKAFMKLNNQYEVELRNSLNSLSLGNLNLNI